MKKNYTRIELHQDRKSNFKKLISYMSKERLFLASLKTEAGKFR